MNKTKLMQVRDALSINRVMAKDPDGNYTLEVTPNVITDAIALCEAELARVDEPVAYEEFAVKFANGRRLTYDKPTDLPSYIQSRPLYATPQEAVSQPGQAVELSQQEAEALAHRRASRYTHRSEPSYVAYTFLPHTLMDFVRDVIAAINAKGAP